MSAEPRFLVVDGYRESGRAELAGAGATPAGELYARMLARCHPGSAADIVYAADPDAHLPAGADLRAYDGIAWTGSSLTVYRDEPSVRAQLELARAAFAAGIPGFGSCWAAQIAALAAGGRCAANPRGREMGIARKIALTPEGRAHPLYEGKPSVFDAFISHEDEVTHLPPGGLSLAGNAFTRIQALSVGHQAGTVWAVQYHPEYDLHELARLTDCRADKLVALGFFPGREAASRYVADLEALHQDPGRRDIAWRLGIDDDVLDEGLRTLEVRNWIRRLVLPAMRR